MRVSFNLVFPPMPHVPPPKTGFIDSLSRVKIHGGQRWTNASRDRYYEWDALHGEWEVYNRHGKHLGSADANTGSLIKPAV